MSKQAKAEAKQKRIERIGRKILRGDAPTAAEALVLWRAYEAKVVLTWSVEQQPVPPNAEDGSTTHFNCGRCGTFHGNAVAACPANRPFSLVIKAGHRDCP